jgi:hypothetical protein
MILDEIDNLIEESKKRKLLKYATIASIPTGAYLYGKITGADEAKVTAANAGIKAATNTMNTLFNDKITSKIPMGAVLGSLALGTGVGYHLTKKKKESSNEYYPSSSFTTPSPPSTFNNS